MLLSGNKKNNVYPCKPQFCYINVGFKGVKTIWACFRDASVICYGGLCNNSLKDTSNVLDLHQPNCANDDSDQTAQMHRLI